MATKVNTLVVVVLIKTRQFRFEVLNSTTQLASDKLLLLIVYFNYYCKISQYYIWDFHMKFIPSEFGKYAIL